MPLDRWLLALLLALPVPGYVVGDFIARRTTDGGQTWQPLPGVNTLDPMSELFFTDALHGFVFGDFHTWRSTNGGASWTESMNPNNFLYAGDTIVLGPAHFLALTNLEGAGIYATTDGGQAWTTLLEARLGGFLDFDRLADGTLVAVTDTGDAYRSTDAGATWTNATYTARPSTAGRSARSASARADAGPRARPHRRCRPHTGIARPTAARAGSPIRTAHPSSPRRSSTGTRTMRWPPRTSPSSMSTAGTCGR
jgi:photosystem II stability/assembly factor-like uncharacterized protein